MPDNYYEYFQYLPLMIIMFVLAFLLTPLIGQLALKYGITDNPASERETKWNKFDNPERHLHERKTPYLGGMAVLIPLAIIIPLIFNLQSDVIFLYVGLLILMVSGVLDDLFNMPAPVQLALQLAATMMLALMTEDIEIIKIPFDGTIDLSWLKWTFDIWGIPASLSLPGDIIMMIWAAFFINAVKWTNGIDVLMEGTLVIAFSLMFILGVRTGDIVSTATSLMLVGGLAGFTIFNFPPAKIFTGSSKSSYAFIAAALAVIGKTKTVSSFAILLLPIIDAAFVLVKRYIKHRPKNLLTLLRMNGTDHLHHQLLKLGISPKQILVIEGSITLLIGSIAVLSTEAYRLFVIIFGAFLIFLIISAFNILASLKQKKVAKVKEESPESKYSY